MRLHIGNLPKTMSDPELTEMLSAFAAPTSVEIIRDNAGASKGFGFADVADADQAKAMIAGLDGKDVGGQILKVAEARPRKPERAR